VLASLATAANRVANRVQASVGAVCIELCTAPEEKRWPASDFHISMSFIDSVMPIAHLPIPKDEEESL
jgi:hypothetical protein